jgi:hypothetical protein
MSALFHEILFFFLARIYSNLNLDSPTHQSKTQALKFISLIAIQFSEKPKKKKKN